MRLSNIVNNLKTNNEVVDYRSQRTSELPFTSCWSNENIEIVWKIMKSQLGNKVNLKDAEMILDDSLSLSEAVSRALELTHILDASTDN